LLFPLFIRLKTNFISVIVSKLYRYKFLLGDPSGSLGLKLTIACYPYPINELGA